MNWIDIVLVLALGAMTALAAQRKLSGLFVGLGGMILLRPLLLLGHLSGPLAVLVALLVGVALGFAGRTVSRKVRRDLPVFSLLGGLGGFLLGVALLIVVVTSLPIGHDISGRIVYPPQDLREPFVTAVQRSRLVDEGRDILLYPLLERQGLIPNGERATLHALHDFFIVGTPWEGG